MRQAGDEPGDHEFPGIGRDRRQQIADQEERHQQKQQGPTVQPCGQEGDEWRADEHSDRIGGDDVGRLRQAQAQIHRRGPWRSFEAVEFATLTWVDWFNNRRLLEPIGNIPPAEADEIITYMRGGSSFLASDGRIDRSGPRSCRRHRIFRDGLIRAKRPGGDASVEVSRTA